MSTDIQGESNQNHESHSCPMSPQRSVSNDISGTSYASSSSQYYSEDSPSTELVKHPLLTPKQLPVGVAEFRDQVSIPEPVLDGVWKKATNLLMSNY